MSGYRVNQGLCDYLRRTGQLLLTFSGLVSLKCWLLTSLYIDVYIAAEYAPTFAAARCGTDNLPVCLSLFRRSHER